MFKKLNISYLRRLSSNFATHVEIDTKLREHFDSSQYKPRKHPGKIRVKVAAIPPDIRKSITIVLEDNNAKTYHQESQKLASYLHSRLLPPEDGDIDEKAEKIYQKVSQKVLSIEKPATKEEQEETKRKIQMKVFSALKKQLYSWGNIAYDHPTSLQYLMTRAAPEYAVILHVLDEIKRKLPDYKPRSFFDFGSGVGTGTWAVNTMWKGDIFEYFCVDSSATMNDLARLILCHGKENVEMPLRGFFQRQFLPASTELKYSIVLSAYSLFEMPSMKSRLETIQKLWNKTEDFLIVIEQGSNSGFKIVNEAREYVLNLEKGNESGYAFAPCPNDNVCPRYLEHQTPCNFIMKYEPLPYPSRSDIGTELFSYVILRKGVRPADDEQWPRVVRAPIVRSGHTVCRLCTAKGELEEIIFSKAKFDQTTYRCARSSNWGDLLPVK